MKNHNEWEGRGKDVVVELVAPAANKCGKREEEA